MTWTNEFPTISGWYWYRDAPGCPVMVIPVERRAGGFQGCWGSLWQPVDDEPGEWAGPIEEPI